MKVRSLLTGRTHEAELTTDHAASSCGQPVVVVRGEAVDPLGLEIVEISRDELAALPLWWAGCMARAEVRP